MIKGGRLQRGAMRDRRRVGIRRVRTRTRTRQLLRAEPPTRRTMLAAEIGRQGPPSVLRLQRRPVPKPGPREVLIALHAAGVGPWDAEMRGGWWPEGKPKFPVVLGSDGAGTIVARGALARRFKVGDKVWAFEFINPKGGFYAECVAVNEKHVGRLPRNLDLLRAGGAAVTGLTALQGVEDHLRPKRGERIIIHGASGAVGTLAVQFAKWRGAKVLATASGRDGAALAKRLGADAAVDGHDGDIVAAAKKFAPKGVDGVLAFAGGKALERCLSVIRRGGRLVYPQGVEPVPKKRAGITFKTYSAEAGVKELEHLRRAAESAKLKVPIGAKFPLSQVAKAHERIADGHVLGKVVLKIGKGQGS